MEYPAPRLGTETKTFGQRVGAIVVDSLLLGVVFGVFSAVVAAAAFVLVADPTSTVAINAAALLFQSIALLGALAYFVYMEGTYGQTLGKRVVGIVVVDEDGDPIDYGTALVRTVFRVVDALPVFYILGAAVILVTERGQRVGDLTAETVVVEAK